MPVDRILQFAILHESAPVHSGSHADKWAEEYALAISARWHPALNTDLNRVSVQIERSAFRIRFYELDFVDPCADDMSSAIMAWVCCYE